MRTTLHILVSLLIFGSSCSSEHTRSDEVKESSKGDLYISEFGQVEVLQLNDSTYQTTFTANDGFQFDTSMVVATNDSIFQFQPEDKNAFTLNYHWGGLHFFDNKIQVFDFAGYGMLGAQTHMWEMYEQPFYKADVKHKIAGEFIQSKSIKTINGIHLLNTEANSGDYYEFEGKLIKEEWPIEYYSTADSPQGILGADTSKIEYRIVMQDPKDVTPEPFIYEGNPVNSSDGKAAIAWEFADSEAYILEGHPAWTLAELDQKIKVAGYLIQNEQGSVLKNWKLID